jgi:hypothetical protein
MAAVGDMLDPALAEIYSGRRLFAQSIHHVCMLDSVLLDWRGLENTAVETCAHLADSRGIGAQMLKQSELAQQANLVPFNFFSSEERWAARTRIDHDDAPALLSQHSSQRYAG